jgi:hypothetical protein
MLKKNILMEILRPYVLQLSNIMSHTLVSTCVNTINSVNLGDLVQTNSLILKKKLLSSFILAVTILAKCVTEYKKAEVLQRDNLTYM